MLFEPRLPRLTGGKAITVEECVETRVMERARNVSAAAASARE
jgi:hypothetical protein